MLGCRWRWSKRTGFPSALEYKWDLSQPPKDESRVSFWREGHPFDLGLAPGLKPGCVIHLNEPICRHTSKGRERERKKRHLHQNARGGIWPRFFLSSIQTDRKQSALLDTNTNFSGERDRIEECLISLLSHFKDVCLVGGCWPAQGQLSSFCFWVYIYPFWANLKYGPSSLSQPIFCQRPKKYHPSRSTGKTGQDCQSLTLGHTPIFPSCLANPDGLKVTQPTVGSKFSRRQKCMYKQDGVHSHPVPPEGWRGLIPFFQQPCLP